MKLKFEHLFPIQVPTQEPWSGDVKEAKRLLYEVIEGEKGGAFSASNTVFVARLNLTDILMEEFRGTQDPEGKSRLYTDMKSLAFRNHVALADDFELYESQTAIPMALMARKLGPASEFQSGMENIFKGGVAALTDKDGWNDNPAFSSGILSDTQSRVGV